MRQFQRPNRPQHSCPAGQGQHAFIGKDSVVEVDVDIPIGDVLEPIEQFAAPDTAIQPKPHGDEAQVEVGRERQIHIARNMAGIDIVI